MKFANQNLKLWELHAFSCGHKKPNFIEGNQVTLTSVYAPGFESQIKSSIIYHGLIKLN